MREKEIDRAEAQTISLLFQNFTHLLDSLRSHPDLKHFVLTSRPQRPHESQPLCPSDFGLASLMSAEAMLHSYVISYRLPLVIARVSIIAEHLQDYKNRLLLPFFYTNLFFQSKDS